MRHSEELASEVHAAVKAALARDRMVNVPAIARDVHKRHSKEKISLTELEGQVLAVALALNALIMFDRSIEQSPPENHCAGCI